MKRRSTKRLFVFAACLLLGVFAWNGWMRSDTQVANAASDYAVNYTQNDWGSGATVSVTITNNGTAAINDWKLEWTFSGNQKITNLWNGVFTQSGTSVKVTNQSYNSTIPANGGKVSFGFNISYSGSNVKPASFTLNGGASSTASPSLTVTPTPTVTPTQTITVSPSATPTVSGPVVSSGLPIPSGSNNVSQPSGAAGNLKTLNWAGFKGAVSYTFDDGNWSQISNYATLNSLGVPFTFYLVTGWSNASNSIWAQAVKDGYELGNHTQSHAQSASGSDIDAATSYIKSKFGVTPYTFAAPYGNTSYVSYAQSRFLLNRGVSGGSIAPNSSRDPFNLPCYIPATGASAGAMTSTVSAARSAGNWQIFCIHGFTGDSSAYQPINISDFTRHVTAVKAFGDVWIGAAVDVGAYWRAQKLLSSITPTTSGGNIIYKWTLPANFPSGKYLRVTVSGGTLKQNNQVLNWDSHGYYEIALDAGSLTITP
jgi:peptidoglycan/xylan/chitin deacetylase (PgdA/CDA1 family)